MKPLLTLAAMLAASAAFSGTTSEPPRDPRIHGDHGHIMQPCGPEYSVGHYPAGLNPQDHCGGDNGRQRQNMDSPVLHNPRPDHPRRPTPVRPSVKGNNGWGNGSQDAPGQSGPRNSAENGPKGKNDGRGKNSGNSGGK